MKLTKLDYAKKKLAPEDYKIILDHCENGWSFTSVNAKLKMSSKNFYEAIKGDKKIDEIREVYCYKDRRRVK